MIKGDPITVAKYAKDNNYAGNSRLEAPQALCTRMRKAEAPPTTS